jgi:hypothetical protein
MQPRELLRYVKRGQSALSAQRAARVASEMLGRRIAAEELDTLNVRKLLTHAHPFLARSEDRKRSSRSTCCLSGKYATGSGYSVTAHDGSLIPSTQKVELTNLQRSSIDHPILSLCRTPAARSTYSAKESHAFGDLLHFPNESRVILT